MALVTQVRDQFRTLMRIRRDRALPSAGQKPGIGARIACGDLRMSVQAGMSDSLWHWLTRLGWREVMFRPDRRRYRDIPHGFVTQLVDAAPEQRERILAVAISQASFRAFPPRTRGLPGGSAPT
ncbi:MAG: hypothetical protein ACXW2G_04560 [Burkholderiaceae bacterium]